MLAARLSLTRPLIRIVRRVLELLGGEDRTGWLPWLATVTGRIGVTAAAVLVYAKAGGAWVRDNYTLSAVGGIGLANASAPEGSVSVGMHCSVESGSRAETATGSNYLLGLFRGSSPLTRPGESSNVMQFGRRWTRSAKRPAAAAGSRTRSSHWNHL
jgi:hypothetical protein